MSIIIICSCSNLNEFDSNFLPYGTRATETNSDFNNIYHRVKYNDVCAFAQGLNRGFTIKDINNLIHCITDQENDTILFACDILSGGFVLISSDTRVPAIIKKIKTGDFNECVSHKEFGMLLDFLIDDMKEITCSSNQELKFSDSDIEKNMNFWKYFSCVDSVLYQNTFYKLPQITIDPNAPRFYQGHYEYSHSYISEVFYDSIPRLTKTNWHQFSPFNNCCPLTSDYKDRAPAGSVAIATAQMMFYLNQKYGIPEKAPSEGYCINSVNDSIYLWDQTNFTADIWNQMATNDSLSAPLIADIGRRIGARYTNTYTYANSNKLVDQVFKPYGIKSYRTEYNAEKLKTCLLNKIPIIVESRDKSASTPEAFIVDQYIRMAYQTSHYYKWVWEKAEENAIVQYVPDSVVVTVTSPYIDQIGINWGIYGNHNISYPLTGDWRYGISPYNYNENRKMIYFEAQ